MTPAWMSGYAADVAYTLGFYRELAPAFLDYVCAMAGVEGLPRDRRLRFCELGCGRGFGTALLAAANPDIDFVGIDFNPGHVGEARNLAGRAGLANVSFLELSFGDAARSADPAVGDFDMVVAHGVFTWVAEAVRRDIVAFLAAKLAPGGIAFVSYNCLPGWAAATPIQHILMEFGARGTGDSLARIGRGYQVLKELADKSAAYVTQSPAVKARIEAMGKQERAYLVHEYLDEHWQPIYVDQAFAALAEAKLTFIGSAAVAENRLGLSVPKEMVDYVHAMPDLRLHELLKDYAVNKQFRRDVYVKGPRRLNAEEARRRSRACGVALTARPDPMPQTWRVPVGEATVKPEILNAIVERLEEGPATVGDLMAATAPAGAGEASTTTAVDILIPNGVLTPVRADGGEADRGEALRLNDIVFAAALTGDTHRFVAAPGAGTALAASFFERLAAPLARDNADADDETLAGLLFDRLQAAGSAMHREGKPIERNADTVAEIAKMIGTFRTRQLPRWRALGVIA